MNKTKKQNKYYLDMKSRPACPKCGKLHIYKTPEDKEYESAVRMWHENRIPLPRPTWTSYVHVLNWMQENKWQDRPGIISHLRAVLRTNFPKAMKAAIAAGKIKREDVCEYLEFEEQGAING